MSLRVLLDRDRPVIARDLIGERPVLVAIVIGLGQLAVLGDTVRQPIPMAIQPRPCIPVAARPRLARGQLVAAILDIVAVLAKPFDGLTIRAAGLALDKGEDAAPLPLAVVEPRSLFQVNGKRTMRAEP